MDHELFWIANGSQFNCHFFFWMYVNISKIHVKIYNFVCVNETLQITSFDCMTKIQQQNCNFWLQLMAECLCLFLLVRVSSDWFGIRFEFKIIRLSQTNENRFWKYLKNVEHNSWNDKRQSSHSILMMIATGNINCWAFLYFCWAAVGARHYFIIIIIIIIVNAYMHYFWIPNTVICKQRALQVFVFIACNFLFGMASTFRFALYFFWFSRLFASDETNSFIYKCSSNEFQFECHQGNH